MSNATRARLFVLIHGRSTVDPSPLLSSSGLGLLSAVPAVTNGLLVGAGSVGFD